MRKNCKETCCKACVKWANPSVGLLVLRVVLGVIFVAHGWQKVGIMEQWIGFITGSSEIGGLGLPIVVAYLVPAVEIVAGLAMIAGVFTCIAGVLLIVEMAGAIVLTKWGGTLIPSLTGGPAYELELILLVAALAITMCGPGKFNLGAKLKKDCGDAECANCKAK